MKVDYAEIDHALRRNGIGVMSKGNHDKFSLGRDGKTLVIYGNVIYSPERDQGYVSDNDWINNVVEKVKAKCQTMPEMHPGEAPVKKSHHGKNEQTTGHHKKKVGHFS